MYFKQFYLGCLAHASYLIGSEGLACVVDPQRDINLYVEEASKQGLTIKYIIETHLHADFVSGHKELAEQTGAKIVISHRAKAAFDHKPVRDNDELELGSLKLKILETPGHTPESICILVTDTRAVHEPARLLTGDTLFVGDVGRPDLVSAMGFSREEMASHLYDSLYQKILVLDEATEVYPAHGAGSLCGKNLSQERSSTIGNQKKFNCALKAANKEEFIKNLIENLPETPQYFPEAVRKNKEGALSLDELPKPVKMPPVKVKEKRESGVYLIDIRSASLYGASHIPGSINISLGGQFATWAGTLLPVGAQIILISENQESINEAIIRLARAGHENVIGYLEGGITSWKKAGMPCLEIEQITVQDLKDMQTSLKDLQVLDVRKEAEFANGHVPGALNLPLTDLKNRLDEINTKKPTAIICRSGYRSSIAGGLLVDLGIKRILNVTGGTNAWIDAGFDVIQETATSCKTA